MPKFKRTPAQQRAELRLRRMSPEQRAIFSTLSVDETFADEEMRKKIKSLQLGTQKEAREKSLEFGERALGLKTRRFEFAKKQILPATIIGAAEAGVGAWEGYERRKTAQEMARFYLSQKGRPATRPPQGPRGRPYP